MLEDDEPERCTICGKTLKQGELVYHDEGDGGFGHAECCGKDPESFVDEDGNPLAAGDPLPEPFPFEG